jgi:hypothetical protein
VIAPFHRRVVPVESGCWEWTGYRTRDGYGSVKHAGKMMKAHRVAYEAAYDPIPDGMIVCHKCDNPACCNPNHLWLGTDADNQRDMVAKGRHANQRKTHCPKGHRYTESNTYRSNGKRSCRTCAVGASRARYATIKQRGTGAAEQAARHNSR